MSPHHGTSPCNKNMMSLTTSLPTLSANNSLTTLHSECLGNVNPSMISHNFASTSLWMALLSDSPEKSRPRTLTTQTWRNCSTTWNGTYVPRPSSTHSTKAVALQSPTPLFTNKEPKSLGPYPAHGSDEANVSGRWQRPSTYTSRKKHPHSTCSYSKTTGSLPPPFTTYRGNSISLNLRTLSGGKYSNKTKLCTTRSSTLKDTHIQMTASMLDMWKHPPKKGMNVASRHHFSILSLSLTSHHLTDYLTYHLTCAPDLVPHDWGAHDRSHNPVTDYLISTLDSSHDQACDLSCDAM